MSIEPAIPTHDEVHRAAFCLSEDIADALKQINPEKFTDLTCPIIPRRDDV